MASYVKGLGLEFRKWVIEWSQTFAGKALLWMPQIGEPITTYYIYIYHIYSYLYFTGKKHVGGILNIIFIDLEDDQGTLFSVPWSTV